MPCVYLLGRPQPLFQFVCLFVSRYVSMYVVHTCVHGRDVDLYSPEDAVVDLVM